MSLSTVIQGLLVAQLPEYEISNDAIGYMSDFSGDVFKKLVNEASAIPSAAISYSEVKAAISKVFPDAWVPLIYREASNKVFHQQTDDKDSQLKTEISDFEIIDDDHLSPKVQNKHSGSLFLSADFIKSYLPSPIASRIDNHGCIYLSVGLESVISRVIQQSQVVVEQESGPLVITKEAIGQAIQNDTWLSLLNKSVTAVVDDTTEFEAVADVVEDNLLEEANPADNFAFVERTDERVVSDQVVPASDDLIDSDPEVVPSAAEKETPAAIEQVQAIADSVVPSDELAVDDDNDDIDSENIISSELKLSYGDSSPRGPIAYEDLIQYELKFKAKKPVTELYGRCCPYFDATTFAIHMLSSIVEIFLLHLVTETCGIARPEKRTIKQFVRVAISRLTNPNSVPGQIPESSSNIFTDMVNSGIEVASKGVEWDTEAKSSVSDAVMYISSRILLVAAAHAQSTGEWVITSNGVAVATQLIFSATSPIITLIKNLVTTNYGGEGPIITPPPAPRIRAAEMIYLTSLFKETPLQLDNQLLVVFMFLVSLSLHTIICVK